MRSVSLLCLTVFLLTTNCARQLTKQLQPYHSSLGYLHESVPCNEKRTVKISIGTVANTSEVNDATMAKTKFAFLFPFAIFNIWVSVYECILGKAAIDQNVETFLKDSFVKEAQRSGCFEVVEPGSEDYAVDLTIIDQKTKGNYKSVYYLYFMLYFYGYGYNRTAGPSSSEFTLKVDLKQQNEIKMSRLFEVTKQSEMLRERQNRVSELKKTFVTGMVEALSSSMKECLEQSVTVINEFVSGNSPSVGRDAPAEQSGGLEVSK